MRFRSFGLATFCLSLCLLAFGQTEIGYNTNQRILRIRELGKKNATVLPMLAQYLQDSNADIRIEAVKAIARIGTERSLDPLVAATRDKDSEVQIRATDGIVNFYVPGYATKSGLSGSVTRGVRQVKSFFASRNNQAVDPDVMIRPDAAQAIGDEIRSASNVDARANAARAAGILRDKAAVPALTGSLHGRDSQLIFECLVALEKIHETSAGPSISFLALDLDERTQVTALEAIGVLRSLPSAPEVRSALKGARNVKVRRAALEALAMLGLSEDRAVFQQYAGDRDVDLRSSALEGLGRVREPEDTPVLQQAFDEGEANWRIHSAAAFGLVSEGKVDTDEFSPLPYLVENLQTKARSDTASAYLTELARRTGVRTSLSKMTPEASKDQKIALCSIFGATQDPNVVPLLESLSKDIDPDVAFAASKALRIVEARKAS